MDVFLERCAGLDVHQASVVCCVLIGAPGRKPQKLLRSFGTTTRDLEALRAWLAEHGVTHVGMESTGVYWKPVYAVLEGHVDLTVGNAHHIKNVPGRKTDVKDAEWIAQLVRHGLVAKSFVPPPAIRDLREMVRYRRTLIETRTAMRNRVLKLLEGANIKLSGVASDVFGVSGMAMLEALAAGTNNATEMAGLARGRMRRKHAALEAAVLSWSLTGPSSGDLSFDVGWWLGVDEGLQEGGPVWEDHVGRDDPDVLEEAGARPLGGSCVDPELFEAVADGVDGKRQQVEGGEQHGEVLLAVAEVVFEVVAVGLGGPVATEPKVRFRA